METNLPTPTTDRVYVNLLEGNQQICGFHGDFMWFPGYFMGFGGILGDKTWWKKGTSMGFGMNEWGTSLPNVGIQSPNIADLVVYGHYGPHR